ncbi:type II toxin-antitoxin system VapC family toxin [bacterium M00.F.Ca.ET.228.01.1.1]|nr:type II toxin-antitoxin system VapC family toxin [bacterium M00.F.Ca.ET.228.01.1.1]TGS02787.1 type II toxin-antitoxin system VapC family toxin [bacterium M00.F.Ca.ET.191.01.1.1]TGU06169.1 type II toxin-antitoxin system VapC family toxin [bacterium M00.F.Ca.ET.155.01.1.1]
MYLLDTSVVSDIVNNSSPQRAAALAFIEGNSLYEDKIFVCSVTLGEMRFGRDVLHLKSPRPAQALLEEIELRIVAAERFSGPLQVSKHVAADYARLRAAYAKGIAPKLLASNKLKSLPPERWHQELPAAQLQITENDLWIAAVAVTYDLILVTRDKDYQRVKKHFPDLNLHQL